MKTMEERLQDDTKKVDEKVENMSVANSITFVTLAEAGQIDGVTAGEHIELFEEWKLGIEYKVGNYRQYDGILYRCISAHTSQTDWTPDVSVSLWVKAADPNEEWPDWSQPKGAHDAYQKGDKVTYNDKHYICVAENNSYPPDVYGWEEVAE